MPGAAGVLLLITISNAYVFAVQASQTGPAPADIAQLSSALKLLRLQLKQATETAEHVGELLLQLDKQSSSPALPKDSYDDHLPALPNQNVVPLVSQDSPQNTANSVAKIDQQVFSRTLAQRVTNWADDFLMLSAVKADSTVTAMTVLTHPPGGLQNQFLVLGDVQGKLYAFNTRGQLALEHDAGSSIQCLAASARSQDRTMLVAGLANGSSQVFQLQLSNRHAHLQQQLQKEETQLLQPTDPTVDVVSDSDLSNFSSSTSTNLRECDTAGSGAEAAGVSLVGILRAGAARQVVAALADGQLLLYRENGTVGASGRSNQAIRAIHISGTTISLVSTHYFASAHVHGSQLKLRTRHLAGLNGSVIAAAAFDSQVAQRGYAVTTDMDLLLLQLPDPEKREAKVLSRVPLSLAPGGGPLHLTHVRGYLVLAAPTGLAIFNTTGYSNRRAPKMILAHPYSNVASAFASGDMFADAQVDPPLTTAQGSLVAVSLGEGVVGLFESKLPFKEIDKYPLHAMSRPLLIIGMLGVGGWQYVRTKRRHDAGRSGKAAWPPDWGPGDASRFAEFPELPKSRTQLGPPRKGSIVREGIDNPPIAQKTVAGLASDSGSPSNRLSLQDIQNISSADLDAMVFQQQPYKRTAGLPKQ